MDAECGNVSIPTSGSCSIHPGDIRRIVTVIILPSDKKQILTHLSSNASGIRRVVKSLSGTRAHSKKYISGTMDSRLESIRVPGSRGSAVQLNS